MCGCCILRYICVYLCVCLYETSVYKYIHKFRCNHSIDKMGNQFCRRRKPKIILKYIYLSMWRKIKNNWNTGAKYVSVCSHIQTALHFFNLSLSFSLLLSACSDPFPLSYAMFLLLLLLRHFPFFSLSPRFSRTPHFSHSHFVSLQAFSGIVTL